MPSLPASGVQRGGPQVSTHPPLRPRRLPVCARIRPPTTLQSTSASGRRYAGRYASCRHPWSLNLTLCSLSCRCLDAGGVIGATFGICSLNATTWANNSPRQAVPGPYATSTANSTKSLTSLRVTASATLPMHGPPRPGNSGDPARSHRPGRVSVHESRWHPMTPHLAYITFPFLFSPFQTFISR